MPPAFRGSIRGRGVCPGGPRPGALRTRTGLTGDIIIFRTCPAAGTADQNLGVWREFSFHMWEMTAEGTHKSRPKRNKVQTVISYMRVSAHLEACLEEVGEASCDPH